MLSRRTAQHWKELADKDKRFPVTVIVNLDGQPLPKGQVTFRGETDVAPAAGAARYNTETELVAEVAPTTENSITFNLTSQ